VLRAYGWSITDYLLERYGTEGLIALCAALGSVGPALAFEEALGLSPERFESAWRAARIRPLRTVVSDIMMTVADRERAIVEKDEAGFLSTVTLSDRVLRAEERHWFAALTGGPAASQATSYTMEAELIDWLPQHDEALVRLQTRTVLANGVSSRASYDARFVRQVGRWRYGGPAWAEYSSEHFVLKTQRPDREWAERVLAQAERAYLQVASDLSMAPDPPLEIKAYEDEEHFQESVGSPLAEDVAVWSADGQSIKLWVNSGQQPTLGEGGTASVTELIARGLTDQVLSAQGVEAAWIREGVAAFEADRLRPLGAHWGSASRQPAVRDALGSRRVLGWDDLRSFEHLTDRDLQLARAQSWSLVTTIVDDHGLHGLSRFMAEAGRLGDADLGLQDALGLDPDAFLATWRDRAQNLRGTHGPPAELTALARRFDSDRALEHVAMLASPEFGGRRAGSRGAELAAEYIAEQFFTLGLEPLSASSTSALVMPLESAAASLTLTLAATGTDGYLQSFPISYTHLLTVPTLALLDVDGRESHPLAYREDFVELTGRGVAEGELVWVSTADLEGLRFDGAVVVDQSVDNPAERARELRDHGASGLLVVTDRQPEELGTSRGASISPPQGDGGGGGSADGIPVFELTESALMQVFDGMEVVEDPSSLPPALPLQVGVRMVLPRLPLTTTQTANVLGYLPGTDPRIADEVLVIGAHYDHIGPLTNGDYFPGANQNASGVATMLEVARLWQSADYRPLRGVLFAAWGAEEAGSAGVEHYLSDPIVPLTRTAAVISLDSIADGDGYRLWVRGDTDTDLPLTHRMEISALRLGWQAWRKGPTREGWHSLFSNQAIPTVKLTWAEAEGLAYRLTDTVDALDPDRLTSSGETLTLALAWLAGQ
jgi:hypothetical protein